MTEGKGNAAERDARTGLEQVEALYAGEYPVSPMTELMPFTTLPPKKGALTFQATPDKSHLNGFGVVHGGWAMTMLDNAMGLAAHSMVGAGEFCPSIETSVKFLSKIIVSGDVLKITAWVTGEQGRDLLVEGKIETPGGKVLATGKSTCRVIRPEPRKSA